MTIMPMSMTTRGNDAKNVCHEAVGALFFFFDSRFMKATGRRHATSRPKDALAVRPRRGLPVYSDKSPHSSFHVLRPDPVPVVSCFCKNGLGTGTVLILCTTVVALV